MDKNNWSNSFNFDEICLFDQHFVPPKLFQLNKMEKIPSIHNFHCNLQKNLMKYVLS